MVLLPSRLLLGGGAFPPLPLGWRCFSSGKQDHPKEEQKGNSTQKEQGQRHHPHPHRKNEQIFFKKLPAETTKFKTAVQNVFFCILNVLNLLIFCVIAVLKLFMFQISSVKMKNLEIQPQVNKPKILKPKTSKITKPKKIKKHQIPKISKISTNRNINADSFAQCVLLVEPPTASLPKQTRVYRGCHAGTHPCDATSRMV